MSDVAVTVEHAGPCRKRLAIEVPAAEVDARWGEVTAAFARTARLPGFRPGKAPLDLVRRRFAKEIREELRDHLLGQAYRQAMAQRKLEPVAAVDVTDESPILAGAPFGFKVTVDVPPTFELPAYTGVELEARSTAVTDAQIEEALTGLRDRMARYREVTDRPVRRGDVVRLDYTGVCDGKPAADVAASCKDAGEGKDFWTRTDDPEAFLPGLNEALAGLATGATRELSVTFPADYHAAELAGKQATYTVTVKEIREKEPAPMDEEFFKAMGVADEAALRARLRQSLEDQARNAEESRKRDVTAAWLLEQTPMADLPQTEVQAETQQTLVRLVRENTRRGVDPEKLREQSETLMNAAARTSQERVRLNYILTRIADQEKIETTDEEVESQVSVMAMMRRTTPAKLKAELEKNDRMADIRAGLRQEKALAFVMARAAWKTTEGEGAS